MLPQANELSSQAVTAPLVGAGASRNPLIAREQGGVALQDPSQGLLVQVWTLTYQKQSGEFWLTAPNHPTPIILETRADVTQVSVAFDRNMNYAVSWTENGQAKFKWYDSTIPGFRVWETELGTAVSPMVTHDDKRANESAVDDVILTYLRDGSLYCRYQRDRYGVEYHLADGLGADARITEFQMNKQLRLQWRIHNANAIEGSTQQSKPSLRDILVDLCARRSITEDQVDADAFYDKLINGYKIADAISPAALITQLQGLYFFDIAQFDGKIHFLPRGGNPVTTITPDDLVERDNSDPITITVTQETELVRKLTLNYIDSTADYATNSQTAERRAATVNAQTENSVETPVSMTPTEAKQTVENAMNAYWAETVKYEFALPLEYSFLTPGDVVFLVDTHGYTHRVRIYQMTFQNGTYDTLALADAPWAYNSAATGISMTGNAGSSNGNGYLPSDADYIVLNIPLFDGRDDFGFYMASFDVQIGQALAVEVCTIDGALPITQVGSVIQDAATVGIVTEPLVAEVSNQYLSQQSLTIALMGDAQGLDTITLDELQLYEHLIAIEHTDGTWEISQFTTSTLNADGTWTLSGLFRGRYDTKPIEVAAGARAVLLDSAVTFVPISSDWRAYTPAGHILQVRAIDTRYTDGSGGIADDWGWLIPNLNVWQCAREWVPTDITASRSGTDVTVTFTHRPRLNVETAPSDSANLVGWDVSFNGGAAQRITATRVVNGQPQSAINNGQVSVTFPGIPNNSSFTVATVNSITGAGEASAAIQV